MRVRSLTAVALAIVTIVAFAATGCGGGGKTPAGSVTPKGTIPPIVATSLASGTVTPGPGTPSSAQVPPEARAAADAVVQEILRRFIGVHESDITVVSVTAKQWADSCLEVVYANDTLVCAQVITPGYEVVVHFGDTTATWHTNSDGSLLRFASQEIAN